MTRATLLPLVGAWLAGALCSVPLGAAAAEGGSVFYQCPGNVFTNTISAHEAREKGCKAREAAQVTSIPATPRPRVASTAPRSSDARIDPEDQKSRDTDSRKILEAELRKAQEQLDGLRKEYNNGAPERRGDEHNYQKYLDRVAGLKAAIARTEGDVAALGRELAKTP